VGATADNSGHTATLRYAKIWQSRTSYVRKMLYKMAVLTSSITWGQENAKTKKINRQSSTNVIYGRNCSGRKLISLWFKKGRNRGKIQEYHT